MNALIVQLIPPVLVILTVVLTYAWHYVYAHIPQAQRDVLAQTIGPILTALKGEWNALSPADKRAKALALIQDMFQALDVALPSQDIIDAFLNALLGAVIS